MTPSFQRKDAPLGRLVAHFVSTLCRSRLKFVRFDKVGDKGLRQSGSWPGRLENSFDKGWKSGNFIYVQSV
jgi:hypothetical protein